MKKSTSVKFAAAALSVVTVLGSGIPVFAESASEASEAEVIQVAGVTGKKPYTFVDENGEFSGYDFEVLKLIDEKLEQYDFEYTALEQDALLVGLQSGKYDLASCSFYGTKERFETFDHSNNPVSISDARLIVRSDEDSINSLEDLASSDKQLAPIPTDDARYTIINAFNAANPDLAIDFEGATEQSATTADTLKAVANGVYDAAIYPFTSFTSVQADLNLDLKVTDSVGLFPTVFLYTKAADRSELIEAVDAALQELRDDGTLSELSEKWYGEDAFSLEGADELTSVIYWED
ncbi:MAG: transporter substrate-binding domain-containing protein [Lachnospiraceae bacterium]|nr:transporter substrate-binding domain-containing protein [Lachnospiraceae bacterium]